MLDLKLKHPPSIWALVQTAALLALLTGLYATSHTYMVGQWSDDDYSYCYLLPGIIAYIVWGKRDRLQALSTGGGWGGLIPIALGLALYVLGEYGSEMYSQFLSSWFVVFGLCWLFFGLPVIRELGFAFLLLFTMMPLPNFLNNRLAVQLQLIASQMGEALIRLMGMSVYREGNIIDLGFMQLQVVEACSGLRYLFPLIVLGLVLTYFTRLSVWKKCVMVAAAVPISLALNALRIALTGYLGLHFGMELVQGFSHDFAGWFIFLVSFTLLYGLSVLLGRLPGDPAPDPLAAKAPAETAPAEAPAEAPQDAQAPEARPSGLPQGRLPGPRFLAAALALGAVLVLVTGQAGVESPPPARSFGEFPLRIGERTGKAQFLDKDALALLKPTQYLLVDYFAPDNSMVNLYVAYYRSQRKGEAIHSPESCLQGAGWSVEEEGVRTLPASADGKPQEINRAVSSKGASRVVTYFWFAQHGRKLTTLPMLKFYTFLGGLTLHRTDGALVRLSTPLAQHEPVERGDARLLQFMRESDPILRQFVPE